MTGTTPRGTPCRCQICAGRPDEAGWNAYEHDLVARVETHGWMLVLVSGEDQVWGYTVGLAHTFGVPEVAMFGYAIDGIRHALNTVGRSTSEGQPFQFDARRDDVFTTGDVMLRLGHPSWNGHLFPSIAWFNRGFPSIAQLVWSDRANRFPWDDGFDESFRGRQPDLWRPTSDQRHLPWRASAAAMIHDWLDLDGAPAMTTRRVASGATPVRNAVRGPDGDWQFLDGEVIDMDEAMLAHLVHLVDVDPTLLELRDLPLGWEAWRADATSPWRRAPLDAATLEYLRDGDDTEGDDADGAPPDGSG